ncbi:MAG TPA: MFS transporter, partial [Candidatus Aquilonibacter sp.]
MSTQSSTRSQARPAQIAALWFGIQLIWGAVLGISLQARCAQLVAGSPLATFGVITTVGALAAAVAQLVVGPLSDRLRRGGRGRSGFYVAGVLLGVPALIVFYLAPNVGALAVAFVALQLALNIVIGPYQAIIPDTMPPSRYGIASGWLAAFAGAGNATGAVLAVALGTTPALGYVLAVGLLLSAAVTLVHLRRVAMCPLPPPAMLKVTRTLVNLFISRAFVYLGFYTMLDYLYFFIASVLPQHFWLDATRASGLSILLFTVVSALGAALAARPADRIDERLVVSAGGSCIIVALAVLGIGHTLPGLAPSIAVAGIGWGIFLCADWAFACRLLPPAAMATTMAIWNLAIVAPQMLAPLAASLLLTHLGVLASTNGPHYAILLAGAEM